jgi:hypothetical protein
MFFIENNWHLHYYFSDHMQHVQEQAMAKSTVSLAQSDTSSIQSSVSSLNDRETKRPRLTDDVRSQILQHLQQLAPQLNTPQIQVIPSAPPPVPEAAQSAFMYLDIDFSFIKVLFE